MSLSGLLKERKAICSPDREPLGNKRELPLRRWILFSLKNGALESCLSSARLRPAVNVLGAATAASFHSMPVESH